MKRLIQKLYFKKESYIKSSVFKGSSWCRLKHKIGDNKMSSDSYTFAVQNTIKAAPYVNMVFISFECGINLISINNDSPNLQIFVSGAGKGYAPQNILKIIY